MTPRRYVKAWYPVDDQRLQFGPQAFDEFPALVIRPVENWIYIGMNTALAHPYRGAQRPVLQT